MSRGQKRISIHPLLDPILTSSFHVKYSGLYRLHTENTYVRDAIKLLNKMSINDPSSSRALISNAADNCRTATEIVEHEFVLKALGEKNEMTENLLKALESSLQAANFAPAKIAETLSQVDKHESIGQYLRSYETLPLIKSLNFPSTRSFKAFYEESTQPDKLRKQRVELTLTPRFLLSLLKSNVGLVDDVAGAAFFKNIRLFVAKCEEGLTNAAVLRKAGTSGMETLNSIQRNALFQAKAALGSLDKTKTLSLEEYSKQEHFTSIFFMHKTITRIHKVITNSSAPVDLIKNPDEIALSYNCYKCSSAATADGDVETGSNGGQKAQKTEKSKRRGSGAESAANTSQIIDVTKRNANVYRLLPIRSYDEAIAHIATFHSTASASVHAASAPCNLLFVCDICTFESIDFAVTCCSTHMEVRGLFFSLFYFFRCSFFSVVEFFRRRSVKKGRGETRGKEKNGAGWEGECRSFRFFLFPTFPGSSQDPPFGSKDPFPFPKGVPRGSEREF